MDSDPVGVASGQNRCAGRRAYRLGDVKVRELAAFAGHSVQVRRGEAFRAEYADVGVALVVRQNEDDVRRTAGSLRGWAETDRAGAVGCKGEHRGSEANADVVFHPL